MDHYWSLDDVHLQNVWLTIGSFDGVHYGHQSIIRKLTAGAHKKDVPAVVLTFHPHPVVVLRNRQEPHLLTTPEERAELLFDLGVDIVITHPFNHQVAQLSAREFIGKLSARLGMERLLVGHDFALGRNREGDLPTLRALGEEFGYQLSVHQAVKQGGQLVSSSQIRRALSVGDVRYARRLLGRPYNLFGEVIHGDGRGRLLGIPTANLDLPAGRIIPAKGVYACLAFVDGKAHQAVANIGVRPTFVDRPDDAWVEAHILDFSADLYGKKINLLLIERLRDERRFSGVQALVDQIEQDIAQARNVLAEEKV